MADKKTGYVLLGYVVLVAAQIVESGAGGIKDAAAEISNNIAEPGMTTLAGGFDEQGKIVLINSGGCASLVEKKYLSSVIGQR